MQMPDEGQHIT